MEMQISSISNQHSIAHIKPVSKSHASPYFAPFSQAKEPKQKTIETIRHSIFFAFSVLFLLAFMPLSWAGSEEPQQSDKPQTQIVEADNSEYTSKYTLTRGSQFGICRNYVDLINRVEESPIDDWSRMPYPLDELAKKQGFREIRWREELDKNEYKDLLRDYFIHTFKKSISREYFNSLSSEEQKKLVSGYELKAEYLAYEEQYFINYFNDIRHLRRTRMDMNFDGNTDTVYRLSYCRGHSREDYDDSQRCLNIIFLYDKTQAYSEFSDGYQHDLIGHQFYYKGRPYNYRNGLLGELYGGANLFWEKNICEIMTTESWQKVQRHNEQFRQEQARKEALKQQGQAHD